MSTFRKHNSEKKSIYLYKIVMSNMSINFYINKYLNIHI